MTYWRTCFSSPTRDVLRARDALVAAWQAHEANDRPAAERWLQAANDEQARAWTTPIWNESLSNKRARNPSKAATLAPAKAPERMPSRAVRKLLHARDGFHCKFCGVPVIRPEVRDWFRREYPDQVPWPSKGPGSTARQHAGFQALWATYDHVNPHSGSGANDLTNLVVACQACNCGRMSRTLAEEGIRDPGRAPAPASGWDGLERVLPASRRMTPA